MRVFKDKLRQTFGFPTKKESLDNDIKNYRLKEKNNLENSIATKNLALSYLNEQKRQLELIIKNNELFINSFDNIKKEALEKTENGENPLENTLYNLNGQPIIKANYKSLNDYFNSQQRYLTPETLKHYNTELANILKRLWISYAEYIISNKGSFNYKNIQVDNYKIYTIYEKMLISMNYGNLRNTKGKSVKLNGTNMMLVLDIYNYCLKVNQYLGRIYSLLEVQINKLKFSQETDEYYLKIIEETKKLMETTPEYLNAKLSDDYLKEFGKKH